ncbi:hypothetical protein PUR57_39970 [Streptomyces sp. JV176]|uniref:hypothetical protein n=1 Tax=Streptomyces sp. JV176 TaxID=858630 RepID=UPI002E767ADE|nr:hypothetical protein [Streptomyces sp. JV176]MEE1804790.1 hypothetical protein [Streptomyces sp. JV176]
MTAGRGAPAVPAAPAAHWGTFDAERWWRAPELASLPAVTLPGGAGTVAAMDELLAGFCAPGDLLVTRTPMADAVREGLGACGIDVEPYVLRSGAAEDDRPRTVDALIAADGAARERITACPDVLPYAVLPDTVALTDRLGRPGLLPPVAVVAEVNSKSWSNALVRRLGLPGAGRVVRSVDELASAVAEFGYPVLVKDPYGVSGRDTLEIAAPGVLGAVLRTLGRQVAAGRRIELVVQRRYARRYDFSAHLRIARTGEATVLGVLMMTNHRFRYAGSHPADPGFLARLDADGYFDTLAAVADALAGAGYWGPVGVDSMAVEDGTVVPVLEINARRSLGLLSLRLDQRVRESGGGLRGHLWQVDLAVPPGRSVADLSAALHRDGALYGGGPRPGVTLLGGSTLAAPGGRVYCALFCAPDDAPALRRRVLAAAADAGMTPRGASDGVADAA